MEVKKILFINTETSPYVADSEMSAMGKCVPETMQSEKYEIRTFMPKWGMINERRGQLHEVIRLSGLNITIDDTDHPLLIKVASIPVSRVQVYFIDNDDYFSRCGMVKDEEGNDYTDNGERAIFFARGVIETVKKLRWVPDVIHCQGWMASIVPLYIKTAYKDDPCFENVKVVTGLFRPDFNDTPIENLKRCLFFRNIDEDVLKPYNEVFNLTELGKLACDYSDAVIEAGQGLHDELIAQVKASGKPFLPYPGDNFKEKYIELYNQL